MRTVHYDQTVRFLAPAAVVENMRHEAERNGETLSEFCRQAIGSRLKEGGITPGMRQERQEHDGQR